MYIYSTCIYTHHINIYMYNYTVLYCIIYIYVILCFSSNNPVLVVNFVAQAQRAVMAMCEDRREL